ncbi:MAG: decaprenyl-phosphate phosphoribosyltransferase [Chitinophagales bacterium]
MKHYIQLIRPKQWIKNLFLFIPPFFAGRFFIGSEIMSLLAGFFAFCFYSSSIYIINDYRDIDDDRKHPEKHKRPLASGNVDKRASILISIFFLLTGTIIAYSLDRSLKLLFVMGIYFFMNLFYSLGLKNIGILDILILASGFVLRVKAGAIIADVEASDWLIIMTFLLALFIAIAKRRDDILLKQVTGTNIRKSVSGYNLDFLNILLGLFGAIIIVAYINYTISPSTVQRLGTYRLYYSALFVIAGIMRYLQIAFVQQKSGSPTEILYRDRFIQCSILLWVASIYTILYLKNVIIFK